MMKRLPTYWRIWRINATNKLQETFINRGTNALFMVGKTIRFTMMMVLLFAIKQQVKAFAGYTTDQVIVFFLTYQFIDTFAQVIYRGVYVFQNKMRTGEFDFLLLKPLNPLFQSLTSNPDINDALFIIPTTVVSISIISHLSVTITWQSVLWFLLLLINSFLIVTALHILVLVCGVLTTEVDGIMWLYRDLAQFGRFPVTIYGEPLRFILFFIVPIGVMVTIPAQVLQNVAPTYSILIATTIGVTLFVLSLQLWNWALRHYTSASS